MEINKIITNCIKDFVNFVKNRNEEDEEVEYIQDHSMLGMI